MDDSIKEIGVRYSRYAADDYDCVKIDDEMHIRNYLKKIADMIRDLDGHENSICNANFVLDGGYVEIWDTNDRTIRFKL